MNSDNTARLTTGPVPKTVLFLALPMVVGMFSIIAFNLADTFFVAQLGTQALAAMSFTFPVVMVMHGITIVYLFFIGAPLAFLGAHYWAFLGLLCARVLSDMTASFIAWVSARRVCRTEETRLVARGSAGYS